MFGQLYNSLYASGDSLNISCVMLGIENDACGCLTKVLSMDPAYFRRFELAGTMPKKVEIPASLQKIAIYLFFSTQISDTPSVFVPLYHCIIWNFELYD